MNPNVVLCPVDLSANGTAALAQAAEIARFHGAELHVVHPADGRSRTHSGHPSDGADIRRRLASVVESVGTEGVRVTTAVLTGDPVREVGAYCLANAADLVVVARHGHRYGTYWRPGAYARDLARVVSCPTLVVPEHGAAVSSGSFVRILCAVDFSPAADAALALGLRLAQRSGGQLTLLHVLDGFTHATAWSGAEAARLMHAYDREVQVALRRMHSAVPDEAHNWCGIETQVKSGAAHHAILAAAYDLQADLIVMGTSDRSGLHLVIMASTAAPVLRRAGCPVLMVRADGFSRAASNDWESPEPALRQASA